MPGVILSFSPHKVRNTEQQHLSVVREKGRMKSGCSHFQRWFICKSLPGQKFWEKRNRSAQGKPKELDVLEIPWEKKLSGRVWFCLCCQRFGSVGCSNRRGSRQKAAAGDQEMDFSASGQTWYGREERQRRLDSGSTRAREGRVETQRGAAMLESSASRGMKPREQ